MCFYVSIIVQRAQTVDSEVQNVYLMSEITFKKNLGFKIKFKPEITEYFCICKKEINKKK